MKSGFRVLGIDSGFASTGIAVIAESEARLECLHLEVFHTKKLNKKQRKGMRISVDDAHRLEEIWLRIEAIDKEFRPDAVAVEFYTPNVRQRGISAWKTSMVYAIAAAYGFSKGIPVLTQLPIDLKLMFGKLRSASKEEVQQGVAVHVENFMTRLRALKKSIREHAGDACGHAVIAFHKLQKVEM